MSATERTASFTLHCNVRHKYVLHRGNLKYSRSAMLVRGDWVCVTLGACVKSRDTWGLRDVTNNKRAGLYLHCFNIKKVPVTEYTR
jgi:hypothetical protein